MVDVCKKFPTEEFFSQHKLPKKSDPTYDEARTYIIYAFTKKPGIFLKDLTIGIHEWPFSEFETYEDKLKALLSLDLELQPVPAAAEARKGARLGAVPLEDFVRNPLDLTIERSSAIIIRLIGNFWQFSSSMGAISTKHDLDDHYHTPRRHWKAGPNVKTIDDGANLSGHTCISFFTERPCDSNHIGPSQHVRHGISLNIDFLMPNGDILPTTFDPDIENKGGNN